MKSPDSTRSRSRKQSTTKERLTTTETEQRRAPRPVLLLAATLTMVVLSYLPALSGGFVWDDRDIIENEPTVQEFQPLPTYFQRRFFADDVQPDEDRGFYRPVVMISLAVDNAIGGGSPFQFHLTNLLLHLLCCVLVFLLGIRAGASPAIASLCALAFGLLPRLAESVAWISGRTDLLAAVGVLGALAVHRAGAPRSRRYTAASLLLFGLFAKEVAIAGYCVVALREWRQAKGASTVERGTATLRGFLPFAITLAVYGALRVSSSVESPIRHLNIPNGRRPLVVLETIGTYVWMLLDPLRPRTQIGILGLIHSGMVALGVATLLAAVVLLLRFLKKPPPAPVADSLILGAASIAPVLHIVPLSVNVVAADRFLYLPAAALAILASRFLSRLTQRRRTAAIAVILMLMPAFAWSTSNRSREWGHELLFWTRAVETSQALHSGPIFALADVYSSHNREEESLELYRRAARVERELNGVLGLGHLPVSVKTQNAIAVTLAHLERYDEAERILETLVEEFPAYRRAHYNLALTRARTLRFDEAEAALELARKRFPDHDLATELLRELRLHRSQREALPPAAEDEPLRLTARRAALDDAQGRILEARRGYWRVVMNEDAPADLMRKAVGFLLIRDTLDAAETAVQRFVERHPNDEFAEAFIATLQTRREQEIVP